jgi:DNA-binding transcriptional regulator YiaG
MSSGDATGNGSRPLTGRAAALAYVAERRRQDPNWDYGTDRTYFGPFPAFVQMMSDAEFDRCMGEKVARGELRMNPYAPPATEQMESQPTPRPRAPSRAALPFGQRLRELRGALGWTQRDVAAQLGVSARSIIRYEQGQSSPIQSAPLRALRRLESAYMPGNLIIGLPLEDEQKAQQIYGDTAR